MGSALPAVAWAMLAGATVPLPGHAQLFPSLLPRPLPRLTCRVRFSAETSAHAPLGRESPSVGRRDARAAQPGGRPFFPAGSGFDPGRFPFRMGPFAAILGNEVIFLIAWRDFILHIRSPPGIK